MSLGPQCWACRERRVRCSSEVPSCAKCSTKGIPCPGYSPTRPLRWKTPEDPQTVRRGRNKATSHPHDDNSRRIVSLVPSGALSYNDIIADEISYYNERIAPDLVAHDSPSNPFRWESWKTSKAPIYLNHAYASISVLHRIIRRRYRQTTPQLVPESAVQSLKFTQPPDLVFSPRLLFDRAILNGALSDPEDEKFCRYYVSALKSLNNELSKPQGSLNVTLLLGVMMLLYSQLQQAAYGQWRVHLDGFKSLIDFFGGWEYLIQLHRDVASLLSNVVIIDAIAATTCPVISMAPNTAERHLIFLRILPQLNHEAIPFPVPIPTELLRAVLLVNFIRARKNDNSHSLRGMNETEFTICGVLSELSTFQPFTACPGDVDCNEANLGDGRVINSSRVDHEKINSKASPNQDDQLGYAHYTNCILSVVIIYAAETFVTEEQIKSPTSDNLSATALESLLENFTACETMNTTRESAYTSLMLSLRYLMDARGCSGNNGEYWKLVFWPLAIAGVQSAVYQHRDDFEFVRSQLYTMTGELGSLGMRDAALLIDRLWVQSAAMQGDGGSFSMTWDDVFQDAPLFLF